MLAQRVTVTVHGSDPLSRAGAISHLRHQPTIRLVDPAADTPPDTTDTVAVALADQVDETTVAELRRISRGGDEHVVLVVRELREPELLKVVECGVRAILWRHQATEARLLKAVHSAARGEGELPPDLISRLLVQVGRLRRSTAASEVGGSGGVLPLFGMAAREVDVVRLVAEGLDTRQISEKLAYSERTVKNILHALMTRLQLTNRAHAVAYALREGYI
ncbi:helix-turn-helix transcriptional regulator [Streptomyces beijiangensis]|uniref:Response regulator transcription factor n=1 Tax=Streptomyces beijiangensis TaxID=163361 RepID=A0A939FFN4_9ACTN|nr:response regulator transcription factor [Streptomyces beijiangensis]MBO0516537.1 response regulator transcription factor [Streptomyces beijiangensis]